MTAFDRAWDLVKMPIVPYSLRQVGEGKHEAQFIDPVSGEKLPMTANETDWSQDFSIKDRAFVPMDSREYGTIQSEGSVTEEPYRNRGYMTALYDMAARLAADMENDSTAYGHSGGGWRLRQGGEEEDGMGHLLWERIYRRKDDDGFWPIRDDLTFDDLDNYERGQE